MGRVLEIEFFPAQFLHFYLHNDYYQHLLACVRDASGEVIYSLHCRQRMELREVSAKELTALRKAGFLDRVERARGGTSKLYLRHRTATGRLLEGVFEMDGRDLYGITVYEAPELRLAA